MTGCISRIFVFILYGLLIKGAFSVISAQDILQSNSKMTSNLVEGFINPPSEAKPRVFWWWLNSMATKESITRDLEELKDKGFGGAIIYDGGSSNYEIAKKTKAGPVFGSPEWIELFVFALKEADRLGLESIAVSLTHSKEYAIASVSGTARTQ